MESLLRPPIAHMLLGDRALASKMLCPAPATLVHVCPWRCQVPRPAQCPVPPKTRRLSGSTPSCPLAGTLAALPGGSWREKDLAIVHLPVCQCSTFPTITANCPSMRLVTCGHGAVGREGVRRHMPVDNPPAERRVRADGHR